MRSDIGLFPPNLFNSIMNANIQIILKKVHIISAQKFGSTFRFINDPITISNENFKRNIQNIYPAELDIKQKDYISKNANLLDLNITIQNSRF